MKTANGEMTNDVPDTSTTLLRDLADTQHARWAVFHARYEPMMRAFVRERFPTLDADDVVQETFAALAKALPNYTYDPQMKGRFHNYLTGVLRNKALKALSACQRDASLKKRAAEESARPDASAAMDEAEYKKWREDVYEIALQQFLADESVHERTKQVFVRLAIDGAKPEAVAESFGIPYNTVVKMKERALRRLRRCVEAMANA